MKKYFAYYGIDMAGCFADQNAPILIEAENEEKAGTYAYEKAIELALDYEGMHGFPVFTGDEDFPEEDSDSDVLPWEEIENYIDYHVKEWTPELEKEIRYLFGEIEVDI